jgi:hypothetical protein
MANITQSGEFTHDKRSTMALTHWINWQFINDTCLNIRTSIIDKLKAEKHCIPQWVYRGLVNKVLFVWICESKSTFMSWYYSFGRPDKNGQCSSDFSCMMSNLELKIYHIMVTFSNFECLTCTTAPFCGAVFCLFETILKEVAGGG